MVFVPAAPEGSLRAPVPVIARAPEIVHQPAPPQPASSGDHSPTTSLDISNWLRSQTPAPGSGDQSDSSSSWLPRDGSSPARPVEAYGSSPGFPQQAYTAQGKRVRVQDTGDDFDLDQALGRKGPLRIVVMAACVTFVLAGAGLFIRARLAAPLAAAPAASPAVLQAPPAAAARDVSKTVAEPDTRPDPAARPDDSLAGSRARLELAPAADEDGRTAQVGAELPSGELPDFARAPQDARRPVPSGHGRTHHRRHRQPLEAPPSVALLAPPMPPASAAETGGVTPKSAAALYLDGKYKQAMSEYKLLAEAHPQQRVYAELARILHRKLVETCVRTQPNRREQCAKL